MKNNTLKAMGIAIGAAMSLMYATGMDAQAAEETMLPGSYDEAAQDEDVNGDGDKKDSCTVTEIPGAMDEIEQGTLQSGKDGLSDPVKVAEVEEIDHIGENLTKDQTDEIVSNLKDQYDEEDISVKEDKESFDKAVEDAYNDMKKDFTEDQITKREDNEGNVILDGKKTETTTDDDSLKNLTEEEKNAKKDELIQDGYDNIKEENVENTDQKDKILSDLEKDGFTDENITVNTDDEKNTTIEASKSEAEKTVTNTELEQAKKVLINLGYTNEDIKVEKVTDSATVAARQAELEAQGYQVSKKTADDGASILLSYVKSNIEQSKVNQLGKSVINWDVNNQAIVKEGNITYTITRSEETFEVEAEIEKDAALDKAIRELEDSAFDNGTAYITMQGKEYKITKTEMTAGANINNFSNYNFICNELNIGNGTPWEQAHIHGGIYTQDIDGVAAYDNWDYAYNKNNGYMTVGNNDQNPGGYYVYGYSGKHEDDGSKVAGISEYWMEVLEANKNNNNTNYIKIDSNHEDVKRTGDGNLLIENETEATPKGTSTKTLVYNNGESHESGWEGNSPKVYYTDEAITINVGKFAGTIVAPYATVIFNEGQFAVTCIADKIFMNAGAQPHVNNSNFQFEKSYSYKAYEKEIAYSAVANGEETIQNINKISASTQKEFRIDHLYNLSAEKTTEKSITVEKRYEVSVKKTQEFYGERLPGGDDDTDPDTDTDTDPDPDTNTDINTDTDTSTSTDGEVLGARRGDGPAVLGARRGAEKAVLGKRRSPKTGDGMALAGWLLGFASSLGVAGASGKALKKSHKKEESEE